MCEEVERYAERRAELAAAISRVQLVDNVMQNMNCPLEQALRILGITAEEYQSCLDLLHEQKSA